jgi:hypothetical protein
MSTREHLDAGIDAYHALIRRDPALAAELEGSVAEFFRGAPPTGSPAAALLSARRHLEWFVFERHSPRLFGTPLERLLEEWRGAARDPEPELERALLQSITGVFEVSDVRRGEGAWLRDLTGFGEHPLGDPALAERLVLGDLLVGRLFPVEDGLFAASRAAGVFRSPAKGAVGRCCGWRSASWSACSGEPAASRRRRTRSRTRARCCARRASTGRGSSARWRGSRARRSRWVG